MADNNVICHPWEPSELGGQPKMVFPPIHWVKMSANKKKEIKKGKTSWNGKSSVQLQNISYYFSNWFINCIKIQTHWTHTDTSKPSWIKWVVYLLLQYCKISHSMQMNLIYVFQGLNLLDNNVTSRWNVWEGFKLKRYCEEGGIIWMQKECYLPAQPHQLADNILFHLSLTQHKTMILKSL